MFSEKSRSLFAGVVMVLSAGTANAASGFSPQIFNGQAAPQKDFASVVPLLVKDVKLEEPMLSNGLYVLKCTAVAIAKNWLLTAEHCIAGNGASGLMFMVGSDSLDPSNPQGKFVSLDYACVDLHTGKPQCQSNSFSAPVRPLSEPDLALLHFSGKHNVSIAPIASTPLAFPSISYLSGWGLKAGETYPKYARTRQKGEFRVTYEVICPSYSAVTGLVLNSVGPQIIYPRDFDSGGPLLAMFGNDWLTFGIHRGNCDGEPTRAVVGDVAPLKTVIESCVLDQTFCKPPPSTELRTKQPAL